MFLFVCTLQLIHPITRLWDLWLNVIIMHQLALPRKIKQLFMEKLKICGMWVWCLWRFFCNLKLIYWVRVRFTVIKKARQWCCLKLTRIKTLQNFVRQIYYDASSCWLLTTIWSLVMILSGVVYYLYLLHNFLCISSVASVKSRRLFYAVPESCFQL